MTEKSHRLATIVRRMLLCSKHSFGAIALGRKNQKRPVGRWRCARSVGAFCNRLSARVAALNPK
jgi:hypothetical protein